MYGFGQLYVYTEVCLAYVQPMYIPSYISIGSVYTYILMYGFGQL